jgi:hypothetical protein
MSVPSSVTTTSSAFTNFLLGRLHHAVIRSRLDTNELLRTSIALKSGLFDPDNALAHLHECGLLHLVEASS